MEKLSERIGWKFSLQTIGTIFIVIGVFFIGLFSMMGLSNTYSCEEWNDNWTIQVAGEKYEDQSIRDFKIEEVGIGDSVILENTISEDLGEGQISIAFYTYQSTVEVYVRDELIYEYGQDYYQEGSIVPTNLNIIDFGAGFEGEELRIEITATASYSYRYIERIYIGPTVEIFSFLMNMKFVSVYSSFFIISVSILSIGLALTLYVKKMKGGKTLTIGFFLLMLGSWLACNSRIILLFNENELFVTYLEYILFYIFVIPLLFYFWDYVKNNKIERIIWKSIIGVNISMFIISLILNQTGVFFFPEMLPIFHIFYILIVAFIIYLIVKRWVKKKANKSDLLLSIGFFCFAFGAFIGIAFSELGGLNSIAPLSSSSILPLTSVVLTLFLIGSYFLSIIDYLYEKGEYDSLTKLAYVDFLTNISNRPSAVKFMEDLDSKKEVYSVVSIDVNNLKRVNDELGHYYGDKLLKNLGFLLSEYFSKFGSVARMGGDEFLVVLKNIGMEESKKMMEGFNEKITDFNSQKDAKFEISISYGIASIEENSQYTNKDVYTISDNRMYEMKEEYHKRYPRCKSDKK